MSRVDSKFTPEQVARSVQADAMQIRVLRECLTMQDCLCHAVPRPELMPYNAAAVEVAAEFPLSRAHAVMHALLQKRMAQREMAVKVAADCAETFGVPVTLVMPGMDDLQPGDVW